MAEEAGVFEEIPSGHRETGTDPAVFPSPLALETWSVWVFQALHLRE